MCFLTTRQNLVHKLLIKFSTIYTVLKKRRALKALTKWFMPCFSPTVTPKNSQRAFTNVPKSAQEVEFLKIYLVIVSYFLTKTIGSIVEEKLKGLTNTKDRITHS